MLSILGRGARLCDGLSRREVLRIGGLAFTGLTWSEWLRSRATAAPLTTAKPSFGGSFGKAKSCILIYNYGGPSHLDLWDPKPDAPDNVKSIFQPIATKLPGVNFTEILPKLAQINDKFTMIRSLGYTPNGLFNHTAAIYQMMTGYTTDKVSASGQLEPPSPKDFPNFGSNIIRLKPPTEPMLPFVMLPPECCVAVLTDRPERTRRPPGGYVTSEDLPFGSRSRRSVSATAPVVTNSALFQPLVGNGLIFARCAREM